MLKNILQEAEGIRRFSISSNHWTNPLPRPVPSNFVCISLLHVPWQRPASSYLILVPTTLLWQTLLIMEELCQHFCNIVYFYNKQGSAPGEHMASSYQVPSFSFPSHLS